MENTFFFYSDYTWDLIFAFLTFSLFYFTKWDAVENVPSHTSLMGKHNINHASLRRNQTTDTHAQQWW